MCVGVSAQNLRITGTVTDQSGQPILAATVAVVGTTSATITDFNGVYEIQAAKDATLEFSYVGMATQTLQVAGRTKIDVVLQEDAQQIEELVVVGYGSGVEAKSLVGSVSSVKGEKIANTPVANVSDVLQGKIPGLENKKVPYIDAWGQTEKNDNVALRAFENLLSPGYASKMKDDDVNNELAQIFSATGDSGVVPTRAKTYVEDDSGKTVYLDAEKYVRYAKDKGQYSREYVEEVMSYSMFREMSADEKAEVIKFLFSYANAKAKSNVVDYDYASKSTYSTAAKLEAAGFSASTVAIAKVAMSKEYADTDGNGSVSTSEKKKALKNAGFSYSQISKINSALKKKSNK